MRQKIRAAWACPELRHKRLFVIFALLIFRVGAAVPVPYINTDYLQRLLDQHYAGKRDNSRKIWTVYMFLVWYGVYFAD